MKSTSLEAYENMKPKIPSDQDKILSVLSETQEMTYNEIAQAVRMKFYNEKKTIEALKWTNPNKVSRRMSELVRLNKVTSGDIRHCKVVKSKCITYLLKVV